MGFQGKEHMRTKIVINGKIIEHVRDFKFERMCGTISITLKGKTQFSTQIKFYKVMAVSVAGMEEGRSSFKILTGKPTGKRPLGRPRRRWEDNIRMDLEEIGINAGN